MDGSGDRHSVGAVGPSDLGRAADDRVAPLAGTDPRRRAGVGLGGLRGGISGALALAIPANPDKDLILAMTYGVVIFSIIVQGLTVQWVVKTVVRE